MISREVNMAQIWTMAQALDFSEDGRVVCGAVYPHPIIYANKAWTKITEYEQNEVFGRPLSFLQGPLTDTDIMDEIMYNVSAIGYANMKIVNYTKRGEPFLSEIEVQPIVTKDLYGESRITHLLGKLRRLDFTGDSELVPRSLSPSQLELYDWVQDHPLSDDGCGSGSECGSVEDGEDNQDTSSATDNDDCDIDSVAGDAKQMTPNEFGEEEEKEEVKQVVRHSTSFVAKSLLTAESLRCYRPALKSLLFVNTGKRAHTSTTSGSEEADEEVEEDGCDCETDIDMLDISSPDVTVVDIPKEIKIKNNKNNKENCHHRMVTRTSRKQHVLHRSESVSHVVLLRRRRRATTAFLSSPNADLVLRKRARGAAP